MLWFLWMSSIKPFCIHPNMSTLQILSLDYAVAIYPLVLILITYLFVSLHDRFSIIVWLWSPFYKCFLCLRREWDIRNSLIDAFATFILLSYVKILNTSIDLLAPVTLYSDKSNVVSQLYLNIDGTIEYFGEEHRPYAILAIVMITIIV